MRSPLLVSAAALLASVGLAQADGTRVKVVSINDFLLDVQQLDRQLVAVQGDALCDSPDRCVLYNGPWKNFAFDTSGLPRQDRRRLLDCMDR